MTNPILDKLKGGSLISDGRSDEVADEVLGQPDRFSFLMEGLSASDDVVRGRAAHALEKVARIHPQWFTTQFEQIMRLAVDDPLPMVRWHLVMLLTDLAEDKNHNQIIDVLLTCLEDDSAFVLSWAISGLCILGRRYPQRAAEILKALRPLCHVSGTAIRTRAAKAVDRLENPMLPIPKGWAKR
jgi:hypothetical protein